MARKILLADDSVTAQNMGRKILADAGYDVSTVNNGSAALKRITEIKPDLIVLDVYMPGYSGLEVCQRLKDSAETAHIPVLLTVGKLEPFKPEEARRVRADAHIVKPFEASELLTAITRLEDRMVPQQSDGSRFSTSVSGLERFEGSGRKTEADGEADSGWKSRLRFPSKKKKEEPEPEPEPEDVAAANFRDFRKGKGKNGAVFSVKAPAPPGQEPGLVPDIPRDITPEELDALSALAAKLDGPIPAAENIAPLADKVGSAAEPAAKTEVATTETEVAAVAADAKRDEKAVVETAAVATPALAVGASAVEAAASTVEGKSEIEIPVEQLEPAGADAAVAAKLAGVEIHQAEIAQPETHQPEAPAQETQAQETPHSEAPAAVVAANTAVVAQEPAPVDKTDEPIFASAASAPAAEEKVAVQAVEGVAKTETETSAPVEAAVAKSVESKSESKSEESELEESKVEQAKVEESRALESKAEELKAEKSVQPVPVAASAPERLEVEDPAPSDAELAEALRLLTPATGNASVATIPSHGTLVAAGQLLAEEAARNAASGPRWVAESVALTPEEAALSLEAEMFRTFAAAPAAGREGDAEVRRITGVAAIEAAVESRLAEAGLASSVPSLTEREAEQSLERTAAKMTPAEPLPPVSNAASSLAREVAPEPVAARTTEAGKNDAEKSEAEHKESAVKAVEETSAEEVAAATFADAVGKNDVEASAEEKAESVSGTAGVTTVSVTEENQDTSSESGGQESMGKGAKGKSNWHQIRTAPANASAGANAVEAAKQAAAEAEAAPKAMAAAAAGEGSASGTDASTIASIVDSVMADLRPKIVEEIAKKLAKRD